MTSTAYATTKHLAADWLRRGQSFEAQAASDALRRALACYEQALAELRCLPPDELGRDLAIVHMNCGNVLQKLERRDDAVSAYDRAISGLQPLAGDHAARNSLGAAWMNRGHAFQSNSAPAARSEALRSHDRAIALLQTLPLDDHPAYRANLAGAWLNRAQVLLDVPGTLFSEVSAALDSVLALVRDSERDHPIAVELSLKARHALCFSLSREISTTSEPSLIARLSDEIDAAMGLARHWEARGARSFRPLACALFRFGAQFYLAHQPQFLAEFLLEGLDPSLGPGATPDASELYDFAREAIARAQADNYNRRIARASGDDAERLREIAEALQSAEERLAILETRIAG